MGCLKSHTNPETIESKVSNGHTEKWHSLNMIVQGGLNGETEGRKTCH